MTRKLRFLLTLTSTCDLSSFFQAGGFKRSKSFNKVGYKTLIREIYETNNVRVFSAASSCFLLNCYYSDQIVGFLFSFAFLYERS